MGMSAPGTTRIAEPDVINDLARGRTQSMMVRGASARVAGTSIGMLVGLATTVLTIRLLTPSDYGVLAFATSTVALVTGLVLLGAQNFLTQLVARMTARSDRSGLIRASRAAFRLVLGASLVGAFATSAVLMSRLGTTLTTHERWALTIGTSLMLVAVLMNAFAVSMAQGVGAVVSMEAPGLVLGTGRLLAVVTLSVAGISTLSVLIGGYAVAATVSITVAALVWQRAVPESLAVSRSSSSEVLSLFRSSLPFAATGLSFLLVTQLDVFVLGLTTEPDVLGTYQPVLFLLNQAMLFIPAALAAPFLPAATVLLTSGDTRSFGDLYRTASKVAWIGSFPVVLAMGVFPDEILESLYGLRFSGSEMRIIVWLLLAGYGTHVAAGLNGVAASAIADRASLLRIGSISASVMVVLTLVLVPLFGALGAAIATSTTYIVMNAYTTWVVHRNVGLHPFDSETIAILATSIAVFVVVVFLEGQLSPNGLVEVAIVVGGAWMFWVGLLAAPRRGVVWSILRDLISRFSALRVTYGR